MVNSLKGNKGSLVPPFQVRLRSYSRPALDRISRELEREIRKKEKDRVEREREEKRDANKAATGEGRPAKTKSPVKDKSVQRQSSGEEAKKCNRLCEWI